MTKTMTSFRQAQRHILALRFNSRTEQEILGFWRTQDPKKIEDLIFKGILRRTLEQTAEALLDMQIALEKTERLPSSLAHMEAWRRLMLIESDEKEEAEAWGMTLDEYRARRWAME